MIIDKIKELSNLTNQEQAVADYIVENPSQILSMTMADLSLASYTSDATIIRLCKKLGFRGYTDFKYYLASQYHDILDNQKINESEFLANKLAFRDLNDLYPNSIKKAIDQTKDNISLSQLSKIASNIFESKKILFYGLNTSYSIADVYSKRFSELGLDVLAETNFNFHLLSYLYTNQIPSYAILISMSGKNTMMVETAQKLKELGIPFLAIAHTSTEYTKLADEFIKVSYEEIEVLNRGLFIFGAHYVLEMIYQYLYLHRIKNIDNIVENVHKLFE